MPSSAGSNNGRPLKIEDVTDDRDTSREPGEATASEHGGGSSYHSADELADEDGLPLGERFPSQLTIENGLLALKAGREAPWGFSNKGIPLRAHIVGLGPETGGSSYCKSVKHCECGDCRSKHAGRRHNRMQKRWRMVDCTGKEEPCTWATWSRQNQRFKAERKRVALAEGRDPSPDRPTAGHRGRSMPAGRGGHRSTDARGRSADNRHRDNRRGRSQDRSRPPWQQGPTSPFF